MTLIHVPHYTHSIKVINPLIHISTFMKFDFDGLEFLWSLDVLQDIFAEIVVVVYHLQIVFVDKVFDSLKVIFGVTMWLLEDVCGINETKVGFHIFTKVMCRDGHIRHDVLDISEVFQVRHLLSRNGSVRAIQFLESWNDAGSGQMSPGSKYEAVIHHLLISSDIILWCYENDVHLEHF